MKYAVLLSGCGIGDGSQLEEAVLTYLALEQNGIEYIPIAPNRESSDVINHYTEELMLGETRNILVESARIGKGKILPLDKVNINDFDGLIVVGGMGVYKNLSNYFSKRNEFDVSQDVKELIQSFHNNSKPIGSMCSGIILVVNAISEIKDNIVVGMTGNTFGDLFDSLNVSVKQIKGNEAFIDPLLNLSNTPAFLGTLSLPDILEGLNAMLEYMMEY